MDYDPKEIARWLRSRREATGKTQQQLATEIGTAIRSVQRWEAGENLEYVATTFRLLSALGIHLEGGELPTSVSAEVVSLRRELRESHKALAEELQRVESLLRAVGESSQAPS